MGLDKNKVTEKEIVIYAKIGNMAGLEEATRNEKQYQIERMLDTGITSRVRKTTKEDEETYEFTIKHKNVDDNVQSSNEYTIAADESFMKGYEKIADRYMDKVRYVYSSSNIILNTNINGEDVSINIPNIDYEVDTYIKKDGTYSEWCKIDIEVDKILSYIDVRYPDITDLNFVIKISHLPFKPTNAILVSTATEEQKQFISDLWTNELSRATA